MFSELWSDVRYRTRALFRRRSVERELDDELRFHIEREAEALARQVRYAARSLRRQPTFTLTVVLILGGGIGASSAVFTVVNGLLLSKLPVPHPEQLAVVGDPAAVHSAWTGSPETDYVSYPVFADIRDQNTVFTGVYANGYGDDWDISIDGTATFEQARTRCVSGGFFSVLQVPAYLGRTFTATEDAVPGQDPYVVISYDYWQRRFNGDRSVIGRIIRVNRVTLTIIGITPPWFTGDIVGESIDFWMPMMMAPLVRPNRKLVDNRLASWLVIMGRLKPGVTLEQARAQIAAIEARSIRDHISGRTLSQFEDDLRSTPIRVESGAAGFSSVRAHYGSVIRIAMAAVGLLVLIVCANVCSLMLARAAGRAREMTVRMALGAGRSRLVRQLLTESAVLAILAGAVGLAVAAAGGRLLLATAAAGHDPIVLDTTPDPRVFAFTAGVTLACLVLFGLAPALRATRIDVAAALRAHGRSLFGSGGRGRRGSVTRSLVLAQIALSTLLLMGSGLLVRSVQRLLHVDLGLDRDHMLVAHVAATRTKYAGPRLAALRRELVARASEVPGVEAASYSLDGLLSGGQSAGHVDVSGFVARADSERQVYYDEVGPGFFHALGARIVRGRDLEPRDADANTYAAAINQTMANAYFRDRDPIGQTVTMDSASFTIAAVVRDVQEDANMRAKPVRRLYFATFAPSDLPQSFELLIRVRGQPASFVEPVRRALATLDPTVPVDVEPLTARIRGAVAQDILITKVTLVFGGLALALAALGLYGVTAYSTEQRTAEFGLRTALGAEAGAIARMVVGESTRLAIAGVVIGIPLGVAAARLIQRQIFGVGVVDVPSLSVAIAVLVAASLVASYVPARRAAGVSPLDALRAE